MDVMSERLTKSNPPRGVTLGESLTVPHRVVSWRRQTHFNVWPGQQSNVMVPGCLLDRYLITEDISLDV